MSGVTIIDPATTWIDVDVTIGRDTVIHPGTQLLGRTQIGGRCVVGPDTTLTDVTVGDTASVVRSHGTSSSIGAGATVGPFTYLRPDTALGADGKLGAFVETKNSTIGTGSKVPHLTYVGDADIGEHSNIGASSVFVNYDGRPKQRTTVGSHVRTGSDTMSWPRLRSATGRTRARAPWCATMSRQGRWQCPRAHTQYRRLGRPQAAGQRSRPGCREGQARQRKVR